MILGLYSIKLLDKCLKPSQKAIEPPLEITSKNPKVHSYVWCIGKIDKIEVRVSTFTILPTENILEHIFLWDKQTPFEFPVVPEVNKRKCISSGLIFIFLNGFWSFYRLYNPEFLNESNP